MKVLVDSCVWGGVRPALEAAGHDAIWVGDWPGDPGDVAILQQSYAEGRVLVTLDKDFGELAIHRGHPHHGIIRLVALGARQQAPVCLQVLARHGDELLAGAIVTAEPGHVRIRLPEPPSNPGSTG
jgi:predicted nuclease of predicted toxin-antitoxin system